MANELLFGIQTNGIKHTHADPLPDIDTRFRMVKEAGVFDYVDKTPAPDEVDQFLRARDKYDIPVRSGGWFYYLGQDEPLLEQNLQLAQRLGSLVHNVQIRMHHADGHLVTDEEVADTYLRAYDWGLKYGVDPSFEVHVNMWSEDFRRVSRVAHAVEGRGIPFRMTLDHSHVIFKMDNPQEQEVFDIRPAVESGELVLDSFRTRECLRGMDPVGLGPALPRPFSGPQQSEKHHGQGRKRKSGPGYPVPLQGTWGG